MAAEDGAAALRPPVFALEAVWASLADMPRTIRRIAAPEISLM